MADYNYEKLLEDGTTKICPMNDTDGSVTGKYIIGVKEWFDENPEERKRLGWIKHITHKPSEYEYDWQTQFYIVTQKQIDEYTVEDEYHFDQKSEEMMALEETLEYLRQYHGSGIAIGNFIFE